jgi:two-component system, cell cycle sensor histidine kinase and response regulator CckA
MKRGFFEGDSRVQLLADAIAHIVWASDDSGNVDFVNARWMEYTHQPVVEGNGRFWLELVHEDDRDRIVSELVTSREARVPYEIEYRLRRWDGNYRWHLTRVVPYLDDANNVVRWIGTATDVEDLKQAGSVQAHLLESVRHAIISTDPAGKILTWNDYAEVVYGWTADEAIGKNFEELVAVGDGVDDETRAFDEDLRAGRRVDRERIVRRRDGTVTSVSDRAAPLIDPHGKVTQIVRSSADVSERLRLEEQFRHAQKMEAVGRLAGGIAHDFNNMLTVIKGHSEFLSRSLPSEGESREDIDQITKAAQRASRLTRQLLAFSRQQIMEKQVIDVNALLRNHEKTVVRAAGEHIRVDVSLQHGPTLVLADPGQFEQAVMNLILNACEAMPDGGELRISTHTVVITSQEASRFAEAHPGQYVAIGVTDSGSGISPENLPRIFEPFFSTKETGRGTGLGLATVYGAAQQLGGFVDVVSEIGKGSSFTMFLPLVCAETAKAAKMASAASVRGDETVLVVEDQDEVRAVARRILMTNGYRVIESRNGAEALTLLHALEFNVDLVLTDAVMPQMGGPELVRALKAEDPLLPVVMVSGYTDKELVTYGARELNVPFLPKPFRSDDLLQTVRKALDRMRD